MKIADRNLRTLTELLEQFGWSEPVPLPVDGASELVAGGEPRVMLYAGDDVSIGVSSAYSREVPYLLAVGNDSIALHSSGGWKSTPGDRPLATADMSSAAQIEKIAHLAGRENVLSDYPGEYVGGTIRKPLHAMLAGELKALRMAVADKDAFDDEDLRDTAVLRLFHQILYARIVEDRRTSPVEDGLVRVLQSDTPSKTLSEVLGAYEDTLDSELFEGSGIDVSALPDDRIRGLIETTIEPWRELKLNFSIARTELASRLYETYLRELPVRRPPEKTGRLFGVADAIDSREKQASFYTPMPLAASVARRALSRRTNREESDFRPRVLDPACGSGAFLVQALRVLLSGAERSRGRALRSSERERILKTCIFGADIDERALGIARVQLLEAAELRGASLPHLGKNLLVGNSLAAPPGAGMTATGAIDWISIVAADGLFDCVLMNPPFGSQVKLPTRLEQSEAEDLKQLYPEVRKHGQDFAGYFVALARRLAGPGATGGFVLPRSFLDRSASAPARDLLHDWGVSEIEDFRGAKVFPGVSASVCTVIVDSSAVRTEISGLPDSRGKIADFMDDADYGSKMRLKVIASKSELEALGKTSWSPLYFEFRRATKQFGRETTPLADHEGVSLRTGVKPANVKKFVISREQWKPVGRKVEVNGHLILKRFVPRFVRAAELKPFRLSLADNRVLLPFEDDGLETADLEVRELLAEFGGLPTNYQRGDLEILRSPKVLIAGLAKEPCAYADSSGRLIPSMRGVHALTFTDRGEVTLESAATLLQSALYQWLMRGLGNPRSDESIEVSLGDLGALPWPVCSHAESLELMNLGRAASEALQAPSARERVRLFRETRGEVDAFVYDLLEVSSEQREVIDAELARRS